MEGYFFALGCRARHRRPSAVLATSDVLHRTVNLFLRRRYAKLSYLLEATFRAGLVAASSLRTMGATRVPSISMARSIL